MSLMFSGPDAFKKMHEPTFAKLENPKFPYHQLGYDTSSSYINFIYLFGAPYLSEGRSKKRSLYN